jgi:hypothetical protein
MYARAVSLLSVITSAVARPSNLCDEFLGRLCDEFPRCVTSPSLCDESPVRAASLSRNLLKAC